jgi:hypothetical protein
VAELGRSVGGAFRNSLTIARQDFWTAYRVSEIGGREYTRCKVRQRGITNGPGGALRNPGVHYNRIIKVQLSTHAAYNGSSPGHESFEEVAPRITKKKELYKQGDDLGAHETLDRNPCRKCDGIDREKDVA